MGNHGIYRVAKLEIVGSYTLHVWFDDGTDRQINFQPILIGKIYGPLKDPKIFDQVSIDPEVHTLVWPNGADFDPETLHDWPKYVEELRRMLSQNAVSSNL